MAFLVSRLRRWFAVAAILMIATVAGMYFYARWSLRTAVRNIPAKIGLEIQQTAEGFSISKSIEGHTLFKVSASKAVQFKESGRAELHNVKIVVYGKDATRFDQITGDDFEYDPASGNVSAKGTVQIDLEANPEGMRHSDQTPPVQATEPVHLETNGLVFNKNTGDASASGKVVFETAQAFGSATGIEYAAKTGTMKLMSAVVMTVRRPQAVQLQAAGGEISKQPRQVVLSAVRMTRPGQQMKSDRATFFLRNDNSVERILAEGDVESEFARVSAPKMGASRGHSPADSNPAALTSHERSDRAELLLEGNRNQLTTAILSGNVSLHSLNSPSPDSDSVAGARGKLASIPAGSESQPIDASAGKVTLHFARQQVLKTVHAEDGVRLVQNQTETKTTASSQSSPGGQDIEMTAPVMDFIVRRGRLLERAETSGPPQITITQPGSNQKTVVTAQQFIARFTEKNRLATLHGESDARIVSKMISSKSGVAAQPDRVSTSRTLDVVFLPQGGVSSIAQGGALVYEEGTLKAWAQSGEYRAADQLLVLSGAPRVVDGGMTTTASTIRMNRVTGDAIAEGNVKSTYSDLKAQPDGAMLASADPIHVTSHSMTVHRASADAVYSGDARLWQNANVVEAPVLQFDRDRRSLMAHGEASGRRTTTAQQSAAQPVSTVLVQVDKSGKATPVHITSARLNYADSERKVLLEGGVTAKSPDATMTGEQMTVFLLPRSQSKAGANSGMPGQVDRIVAENNILITQPARHATGNRLVYTAADDKFVLTGGSPSIFDAERGKITGDSLTFFRHDDRVLVEGREAAPSITRTQVAR